MSGHSHFRTIMHKKGAADEKRGRLFSKLAKELQIAAKDGGADLAANPRLRAVVEKARAANMPADNIERAVKKGAGGDEGQLQEILLDAYGPGGIALLISVICDNRNRALSEIKQILERRGGKLGDGASARWAFEKRGAAWKAKFPAPIPQADRDAAEKLFEALEEHDDVQAVYSNLSDR